MKIRDNPCKSVVKKFKKRIAVYQPKYVAYAKPFMLQ
jgi:hypothetical protein